MTVAPVVVVGAGAAGLTCARHLQRAGRAVQIVEAATRPGGRIHTRTIGAFRCDQGFQVVLDSYPEVRRELDLRALRLGRFEPGAWVRWRGRLHRLSDPRRRPWDAWRTLRVPFLHLAQIPAILRLISDRAAPSTASMPICGRWVWATH